MKAKARAAIRLRIDVSEPGSLALDRKLQLQEVGKNGEIWRVDGQVLARNQVVEWVCREMCVDPETSISKLCQREGMPSIHVFMGWIRNNPLWKKELENAEEVRSVMLVDKSVDISLDSRKNPTQASVKADELAVKTLQWVAERTNRKKFGEAPKVDLGDLAGADEGALLARIVAAMMAFPEALDKLAPRLKQILPPERLKEVEAIALAARQKDSIAGEVVP